jgi:hypothetical protein
MNRIRTDSKQSGKQLWVLGMRSLSDYLSLIHWLFQLIRGSSDQLPYVMQSLLCAKYHKIIGSIALSYAKFSPC